MRPLILWTTALAAVAWAGCGAHLDELNPTADALVKRDVSLSSADTGGDAALGLFNTPLAIGPASTAAAEDDGTMSSSKLELIFGVVDNVAGASKDLYVTTRPSVTGAWTPAVVLTQLNTTFTEESPRLSADDLTLYFGSHRTGAGDIYVTTRTAVGQPWATPTIVPGLNTAVYEKFLSPCAGGDYLMVQDHSGANPPTSFDLVEGTLGGPAPVSVAELNSGANDSSAFLSVDCLTTYFASGRDGGTHLYTAHRTAVGSTWSTPTRVTTFEPVPTDNEQDPWLSTDGRAFVFASDRSDIGGANTDIYISTR